MNLAAELERSTGLDVDLVDLHCANGGLLKEILRGGMVIRKDPHFVAAKYLEMYDYDLFLAPQLRAVTMDEIVTRKLESLGRCIKRIEENVPESEEDLVEDVDAQDIIVLNLERAIQMCVDIAAQAKAGTVDPALAQSLHNAVGLRNIAVHDYSALDWKQLNE